MRILLPKDLGTVSTVVCAHFEITQGQLHSKTREVRIVQARQLIWHLLYKLRGCSDSAIGKAFEKASGTVRLGRIAITNLMGTDADFRFAAKFIESRCQLLLEENK